MEESQSPRKRRRPPRSCEQCRRRKVRCDQNLPCNQCIRMKIDSCSYSPGTLLNRHHSSAKRSEKLPHHGAPPTPDTIPDPRSARPTYSTTSADLTGNRPLADNVATPIEGTQTSLPVNSYFENRGLHVAQLSDSSHNKLHGTITKTRLLGRSHWVNIVKEFSFVVRLQDKLEAGEQPEVRANLERCKTLGRAIKSQLYTELSTSSNIREHVPPKALADQLMENYFRVFESCYRILHVPLFKRGYEQYWTSPETASQIFFVKMLLVFAIGACVHEDRSTHQLHIWALQWINAAHIWSNSPFFEKPKLNVGAVQIHCLLLLARQINAVSPDLVWKSAGTLVRTAMMVGLHRDPTHFPHLTAFQTEVRRRLWATVMEICLQSSMDAGGAPMLSPDMYDTLPPSNLNDEDLNEMSASASRPKEIKELTSTSLQVALVETLPLRCRVAELLNDFRFERSYSETLSVSSKLSSLLDRLSTRLRTANILSGTHESSFKVYELMTYRFLAALHQPYAVKAMRDPTFYFSRKVCLDTSLHMSSAIQPRSDPATPDSMATSNEDFKMIMAIASGPTKNAVATAALVLCVEVIAQLENSHSTPMTMSDKLVRQEIFKVLDAYMEHNLTRVRMGETNVKGYVFAATSVAHLKALVAGKSGDSTALEAGEAALKYCADILEASLHKLKDTITPKSTAIIDQFEEDLNMPFGDFGWDDWDPIADLSSAGFFLSPPNA